MDAGFEPFGFVYNFIQKMNMSEEEVYDMNYLHSLNWLSFWHQQNEIEKNRNKK